jgi:hypothetical protein
VSQDAIRDNLLGPELCAALQPIKSFGHFCELLPERFIACTPKELIKIIDTYLGSWMERDEIAITTMIREKYASLSLKWEDRTDFLIAVVSRMRYAATFINNNILTMVECHFGNNFLNYVSGKSSERWGNRTFLGRCQPLYPLHEDLSRKIEMRKCIEYECKGEKKPVSILQVALCATVRFLWHWREPGPDDICEPGPAITSDDILQQLLFLADKIQCIKIDLRNETIQWIT